MKKNVYLLELELEATRKKLDKEKEKRTVIMGLLCSALAYWVLSLIDGTSRTATSGLLDVLGNVFVAIVLGFLLYFSFTVIFILITKLFTNIDGMESKAKYLEEEIQRLKL